MTADGDPATVNAARAIAPTAGWVLSGCQGAAGSIFCAWVRPGERIRVRVRNISTPRVVTDFAKETLTAEQASQEFFDAWEFGSEPAMRALGDSTTVPLALSAKL